MATTAPTARLGSMTGARYVESLRDGREVWLDGERVDDVTTHPAFRDFVRALADVYDQQNARYRDEMTYLDPESGVRTSLSWLIPHSHEDSARKRRNSQLWNMLTWGQLGRSPDVLAPFIVNLMTRREAFGAAKHPRCDFAENIAGYYRYCRDNDLFLTHALGDPQVDRSQQPQNERRAVPEDEEIALNVVEETDEGVIVSGGKQLSTAAVYSNETYVSLSQTFYARNDPRFVVAFAVPTGSPGLQILAREPVGRWFGSWGHPFNMLDEQDCMLFFQRVLVPWDRVFFLYEAPARVMGSGPSGAQLNFAGWANLERALFRFRLLTAVATLVAEAIGVIEFREVASKLGEMVANCEMLRLAMDGIEHSSRSTAGMPGAGPTAVWMAQTTWRMTELLREICGSGIVMQPSEHDLTSALRPSLERFMRGRDVSVEYKSRLFRVAHDLAMSSFGMRQDIYEYWHAGDPSRNRINLLRAYDQSDITEMIKELCSKPLPHGEAL